ncbi:MAG: cytochrome c [Actinomycetota bacterium]
MPGSNNSLVFAKSGGAAVYQQHCAECHGADGKANTAKGKRKGATDLTKSAISTIRGIKVISNGRELMPGFKDTLPEAEISAVMDYIRGFRK